VQIVVISGKGGTGKPTIATSLSYLIQNSIQADCDVDAANLYLLFQGQEIKREPFVGGKKAQIHPEICTECGKCLQYCRYGAIDKKFTVNDLYCEGCGVCRVVCPAQAVEMIEDVIGEVVVSKTQQGILSCADMKSGADGSGKLVAEVRKNAKKEQANNEIIIIDGSPGIGCAVMASITGCDLALIVTEPTKSGLSDLQRVLELCKHFKVTPMVCINKYDVNQKQAEKIKNYCIQKEVALVGQIPLDGAVKKANNELKPLISYQNSNAVGAVMEMWKNINNYIKEVKI
jgi:MinD superfamily P-loop ATPase